MSSSALNFPSRCAFGFPAEVDLRSCPTTGVARVYLTPSGLMCLQRGASRTPFFNASSPAPPPVEYGPPPPLQQISTSISEAEFMISNGHQRPDDLETFSDSAAAEVCQLITAQAGDAACLPPALPPRVAITQHCCSSITARRPRRRST